MKKIALVTLLALGACQSPYLEKREETLTFVKGDLEGALADAKRHKDRPAVACYTTLLEKLDKVGEAPKGAIMAFQHARNVRRFLNDEDVHVDCSPLVDDAKGSILKVTKLLKLIP